MPAARYWRLVGIETYAGCDLELSELHLYGASGRLDAAATLTSAIAPTAGTLAALQDDNLGTTCRFAGAAVRSGGFALVWDFGVGNTADAIGVRLGAATAPDTFLAGGTLQYSTDGVQWVFFGVYNRLQYPGAGAYTAVPTAGDLDFDKVSMLLHMDGSNGSTTFTDRSSRPKPVTARGPASISTKKSMWGGASLLPSGGYLEVPYSADFVLGSFFTVEAWVYHIARPATQWHSVVSTLGVSPASGWRFLIGVGGELIFSYLDGASAYQGSVSPANSLPVGVWRHVAAVRTSGTMTLYVGGVSVLTSAMTDIAAQPFPLVVGVDQRVGSTWPLNGYVDDLRITKGVARYTANFSPPTEPFPNSAAGNIPLIAPALHTNAPGRPLVAVSAPVPAFSTRRAPALATARDVEHGGNGTIYGTTKTKGTPNQPTHARVVLLHQRSKLPVRETWSDPITGAFAFTGIDTTQQFLTLAEDAAGNFRPVAANRLTPEVLP